jgi:peptidoglycan/LPS O-acetylase OafA/YrhL
MSITEPAIPAVEQTAPRLRLHYLDGVRGLAALCVLFWHVYLDAHSPQWPMYLKFINSQSARFGVDVFIVLSGYCLTIPIAKTQDLVMPGGVLQYLRRRARRILPPYYAALALALLIIALVPGMRNPVGGDPADSVHAISPAFAAGPIISHLLLIHNWNPDWANKIDSPMWSVATEWQIYFFLPLLLLPAWRRFGLVASVLIGVALGLRIGFLTPKSPPWTFSPWFLGLFAMGMAGAAVNFSPRYEAARRKPWGVIASVAAPALLAAIIVAVPALLAAVIRHPILLSLYGYVVDFAAGAVTCCMLIACTKRLMRTDQRPPLVLRLVGSQPIAGLGAFSYSLYLIHHPLLLAMETVYVKAHFSPLMAYTILLTCGIPIVLLCAYVFHLVFERPFMNAPKRPAN